MRVSIIGCGAIAGTHVAAVRAAGQEICALCDIDREKAGQFAQRFGIDAPVYADYAELLERERPDAVHICTPHHLHAEMCCLALRKNIHVLCEKPLCITLGELDEVTRAARESRATLGVCLQNRYEPNLLRLRGLAAEHGVNAGMGIVAWKRDEAYYRSGEWRGRKATEGGGVMINQALHTLDLLQWICGMPSHVTAHLGNDHLSGVIEVEDTATALFELPGGGKLSFFATTAAGADFPAQVQLVTADKRILYADSSLLAEQGKLVARQLNDPAAGKRVWGTGHRELVADFYRCIGAERPFSIGAEEAGKVIRLILAMYASNGNRVAVPEAPGVGALGDAF